MPEERLQKSLSQAGVTSRRQAEKYIVEGRVSVAVGAFADPSFPPPEDSVYESRRHPWVQLPESVTRYDTDPS